MIIDKKTGDETIWERPSVIEKVTLKGAPLDDHGRQPNYPTYKRRFLRKILPLRDMHPQKGLLHYSK